MSEITSDFLRILREREFIHQATDLEGLDRLFKDGPVTAYIGFDCTGPSLHVGSLVQIMMLRWLQKTGNKPVVLMGGGTSRVGDPSGKDTARKLLDDATLAEYMTGIHGIFEHFLDFSDRNPAAAITVNNADWLDDLSYIDFLREMGPHFTINRMLTFDSVKLRLDREQPLTFLEFNYMILQAYDFLELARRRSCRLQMGGSDQWGNIINGVELTRRVDGTQVFGLTSPLITTADGKKMGKTANGAIWLNEAQLPAYDYWQFWRNTQDNDVGRFLRLFTELPLDEIARLEALDGAEINEAKTVLANEATALCRGPDAAKSAESTARETFAQGGAGSDLPSITLSRDTLAAGPLLVDLFVETGLGKSKGEVRRLIKQGGARLNDRPVSDETQVLEMSALSTGQAKLSAGKKRHALIRIAVDG